MRYYQGESMIFNDLNLLKSLDFTFISQKNTEYEK